MELFFREFVKKELSSNFRSKSIIINIKYLIDGFISRLDSRRISEL